MYNISCKEQYSINRNIVECKDHSDAATPKPGDRINRNIVECKVEFPKMEKWNFPSINRNIVECKDCPSGSGKCQLQCVLIETLWNVK